MKWDGYNMGISGIEELFSVVSGASKDKVYREIAEKVQDAFHELVLAEADTRREKTAVLIRTMAKMDAELFRFKYEYHRISHQLSPEAILVIDKYLRLIEQKRKDIAFEKNMLKTKR